MTRTKPGNTERTIPLTAAAAGASVRVIALPTDPSLQSHLAAMGLLPGGMLEILRTAPSGPFLISVRGSRVMLGLGLAEQILVAAEIPHPIRFQCPQPAV